MPRSAWVANQYGVFFRKALQEGAFLTLDLVVHLILLLWCHATKEAFVRLPFTYQTYTSTDNEKA